MWMLADLFQDLPEVGDVDQPKLVFFFDEAHLLFNGSSKAFLEAIEQTVRLIRSKGVGVFFVTQSPTDVPDSVLAQIGSRVQHQLRAHTPNESKALRATVRTYPDSAYDLEEVLTQLGIGEAIVTVMNERGAPTPVAWTRLRAPEASMDPSAPETFAQVIAASPLQAKYGVAVDRDSAHEILTKRMDDAAAKREAEAAAAGRCRRRPPRRPAKAPPSIADQVRQAVVRGRWWRGDLRHHEQQAVQGLLAVTPAGRSPRRSRAACSRSAAAELATRMGCLPIRASPSGPADGDVRAIANEAIVRCIKTASSGTLVVRHVFEHPSEARRADSDLGRWAHKRVRGATNQGEAGGWCTGTTPGLDSSPRIVATTSTRRLGGRE